MNDEAISTEPVTNLNTFAALGLSEALVEHLQTLDFKIPTPIQVKMIPALLEKSRDYVALAPTGTGKTGAFGLPMVEIIDAHVKDTQAIVLCPTRELAVQVSAQLQNFGKKKGVRVVTIYGGASYDPQLAGVRKGAHIIVATPGRLVDFLKQKHVKLGKVKTVVLDEADEMVKMGFKEDLEMILGETQSEGSDPQTWLFSATMSPDVRRIAQRYLKSPDSVEIKKDGGAQAQIDQCFMAVAHKDKVEALMRYIQTTEDFYGLIFCQTKVETAEIARLLNSKGFSAEAINGDKSQGDREKILSLFKQRKIKALVGTDVAARGLDIKDLTHVVNFSLPWDAESYVHRIGRTGRNGKQGTSLSLISSSEIRDMHRIQATLRVQLRRIEIPTSSDLALYKLKNMQEQMMKALAEESLMAKAKDLVKKLDLQGALATEDAQTTLAAFVGAFNRDLMVQKELQTFSTDPRQRASSGPSAPPRERNDNYRSHGPRRFGRDGGGGGGGGASRDRDRGFERTERADRPRPAGTGFKAVSFRDYGRLESSERPRRPASSSAAAARPSAPAGTNRVRPADRRRDRDDRGDRAPARFRP